MKTHRLALALALCTLGFSCTDKYTEELTVNAPVYLTYEALRTAVGPEPARTLERPGKIYFKDNRIFIVEYLQGIHVIDVSDVSNPQNLVFIHIPGCVDLAIKDQSLYADSYTDLVTIDVSEVARPKEIHRLTDVLPYKIPTPKETAYPRAEVLKDKGVVTGWELRREKHAVTPPKDLYSEYDYSDKAWPSFFLANAEGTTAGSGSGSVGLGGSMARFGLYQDYLYVADESRLYLFDAATPARPVALGIHPLANAIETMFIYDHHLFFGTPSGMLVYSLQVPLAPDYIGDFRHTTSCDPVVVQDGYAYITLRAGETCGGGVNRLDIVKISEDYKEYDLVSSYGMTAPQGLGVDGNKLFICDGPAGLKIYDAEDKTTLSSHLIATFPEIQAYDVIPLEGYLFLVAEEGFYLYDYSDYTNIRRLGYIPISPSNKE
ncbi:MAG: hypothetical protein LBD89_09250 [Tannerellaceae bacterium]|jgi:hypothetical protein|nr:hypothetical protein [Tannerellaceae bacterium]